MDLSRWNKEKRRKIQDWEDAVRPLIAQGLGLGFTLQEISQHMRSEALRQAYARWGMVKGAFELGISRQAFLVALNKIGKPERAPDDSFVILEEGGGGG